MAFISMVFAGIAFMLLLFGISAVIIGIVLKMINRIEVKKGAEKSRPLSVVGMISFILGILSLAPILFIVGSIISSNISASIWQKGSLEYNVYVDDIDRAAALLEDGADPNEYGRYIYPPIYFALENDNYDMTKMLLEYGANPDATGAWDTQIFHFAIQNNDLDFIKLLIENGADINFTVSGRTPLDLAYETDNDEVIDYLIENGAKQRRK